MPLWCSGETRQWHSVLRPRRVSDEHPFPKEVLRDIPGVTTRFLSAQEVLEGVQVLQGKPAASAKVYGATEQAWLERMAEERNKRLEAREDDAAGSKSKDAAPRSPTVDILDPAGAGGAARAGKETTKRRPKHRTKPVLASVASLGTLELSDDPKTRQAQLQFAAEDQHVKRPCLERESSACRR